MKLKPGNIASLLIRLDWSNRSRHHSTDIRQHGEQAPGRSNFSTLAKSSLPLFFVVLGLVSNGCAGYHMGNQFLYRSDIRTVHVEFVQTDSFRRFIGQRLTEAIVKQIELSTPLTITEPALADSFVQGTLIANPKRILSENFSDEPRVIQTEYFLAVKWVDRAGVPLMQRQLLRIGQADAFVPEGGESMATSQQNVIDQIARELVGQMETPW